MECCKTKKDDGCCKDLKKNEIGHSSESQMKGGSFKMERRIFLWMAIGVLFLVALYLVFQAGSLNTESSISEVGGKIDTTGWTENEIMNYEMHGTIPARTQGKISASSGGTGMVGGC